MIILKNVTMEINGAFVKIAETNLDDLVVNIVKMSKWIGEVEEPDEAPKGFFDDLRQKRQSKEGNNMDLTDNDIELLASKLEWTLVSLPMSVGFYTSNKSCLYFCVSLGVFRVNGVEVAGQSCAKKLIAAIEKHKFDELMTNLRLDK